MAKTQRDGSTAKDALDAALKMMLGDESGGIIQIGACLRDLDTEIANRRSALLVQAKAELRQHEELVEALGGVRKKKPGRPKGSKNSPKVEGAGA